ncbi:hypothetical protein FA09DRAFT_206110 [Tilletiopsis washingtonensis]|uniref:Uncharacterized protein n=1 Tax=Tilletiopsis washingtonensis TaxID=58919 RepID=A0A316ZEB9_9BASI|nr:hypothetical protein FA09DRAFT_206110 [Tilletiopsis washingtonensis]PWO00108.1 hypothetical protein FA09DRAFT_206110 [Tilletiopsis washingtonensis]
MRQCEGRGCEREMERQEEVLKQGAAERRRCVGRWDEVTRSTPLAGSARPAFLGEQRSPAAHFRRPREHLSSLGSSKARNPCELANASALLPPGGGREDSTCRTALGGGGCACRAANAKGRTSRSTLPARRLGCAEASALHSRRRPPPACTPRVADEIIPSSHGAAEGRLRVPSARPRLCRFRSRTEQRDQLQHSGADAADDQHLRRLTLQLLSGAFGRASARKEERCCSWVSAAMCGARSPCS